MIYSNCASPPTFSIGEYFRLHSLCEYLLALLLLAFRALKGRCGDITRRLWFTSPYRSHIWRPKLQFRLLPQQ